MFNDMLLMELNVCHKLFKAHTKQHFLSDFPLMIPFSSIHLQECEHKYLKIFKIFSKIGNFKKFSIQMIRLVVIKRLVILSNKKICPT